MPQEKRDLTLVNRLDAFDRDIVSLGRDFERYEKGIQTMRARLNLLLESYTELRDNLGIIDQMNRGIPHEAIHPRVSNQIMRRLRESETLPVTQ